MGRDSVELSRNVTSMKTLTILVRECLDLDNTVLMMRFSISIKVQEIGSFGKKKMQESTVCF